MVAKDAIEMLNIYLTYFVLKNHHVQSEPFIEVDQISPHKSLNPHIAMIDFHRKILKQE